jgi:peptide/nickel transport system permease protein
MRDPGRFFRSWPNLLGLTIVGFFVCVAVAAPLLAPPAEGVDGVSMYKRAGRSTDRTPHPPSPDALLGTVPGQLDVFYSLVWGTRHAMRFGLVVALCTGFLGVVVGAVSGYAGGTVGRVLLRITDGFLALPVVVGVGIFRQVMFLDETSLLGPVAHRVVRLVGSDYTLLAFILFSWMPYARVINASVARLREVDYVLAARSLGVRAPRVVFRHLLPNAIAPAIVLVARDIGAMVLLGAALAFMGIGSDSPWGQLAAVGRDYVIGAYGNLLGTWWAFVPVTLVLILFGVGWNLLGDGLNDLLDPRYYSRRSRL